MGRAALTTGLELQCPSCRDRRFAWGEVAFAGRDCGKCGFRLEIQDGILRALPDGRRRHYASFAEAYLAIRRAQAGGAQDPAHYLGLPYEDRAGRERGKWRLKSACWRAFEKRVLKPLEEEVPRPLRVLDLGAGTGWASYRLAQRGHQPAAVDLLDDTGHGLGAARACADVLGREFPLVQAEFDRLPFADQSFDLAIFSASLHHATDYLVTLREARRCLGWGGRTVIWGTPLYSHFTHGEAMRERRRAELERRYGVRLDGILSMDYLDEGMLKSLAADLNLAWNVVKPGPAFISELRAVGAKLAGNPPPPRFWILAGAWEAR